MAVRLAAVALSALLARSSASAPCAGFENVGVVVEMAPACFEACSILCSPMNDLVRKYLETWDEASLKPLVCASASKFECLFTNVAACGILREKAAAAKIELPASSDAMQAECEKLGFPTDTDDSTNSSGDDDSSADHNKDVMPPTSAALGVARLGAARWAALVVPLWLLARKGGGSCTAQGMQVETERVVAISSEAAKILMHRVMFCSRAKVLDLLAAACASAHETCGGGAASREAGRIRCVEGSSALLRRGSRHHECRKTTVARED
eukprot:CAMPEP_0176187970 /NCGR_PEP_ID=MMETSP0121_2-20121125/2673_1 /TAXON_ID=160619 /ORGANISM="Kryptoperidinium foliaceum, Strain CCMP 1326" /LENGTH=267 /DNA_ID=CAMNT_0017526529 /DNA_START=92 /DNA_END=892 /DNA_ORIENTATION=+